MMDPKSVQRGALIELSALENAAKLIDALPSEKRRGS